MIKGKRILGMVGGGLALSLVLAVGVGLSGRWSTSEDTPPETGRPTAASLTPVTFTRVVETLVDGRPTLRLSGLAEPDAVVVLLEKGERIRQVRSSVQGTWSAQIDVTAAGMAVEAVLYEDAGERVQGPTDIPGTLESMTRIRGIETVFRLQQPPSARSEGEPPRGALIMIASPGAPTRLIRSPFVGVPRSGPLSLETVDYDDGGGVIVTGRSARPGSVRLFAGDAGLGESRVGEDGRWMYIAPSVMPVGAYDLRAVLGEVEDAPSVTVAFERLPPLPRSGSDDGSLTVNFGPGRWQVRRSLVGGGSQSTVIFAPAPPLDAGAEETGVEEIGEASTEDL